MASEVFESTNTLRIGILRADAKHPVDFRQCPWPGARQPDQELGDSGDALFEELLENVYDAALITDAAGVIVRTNCRAIDHFEYTSGELVQLNILDLISGATEEVLVNTREYLKNQQHVFIEAYCVRKTGSFFPCEITCNLLHLANEEHLCFLVRNVAVRKEAEAALVEAQQELVKTAHAAGMATIATGVLHNVGNILNSVHVSADVVTSELARSALPALGKLNALFQARAGTPGGLDAEMLEKLRALLSKLVQRLGNEHDRMQCEMQNLAEKIQLIRAVIGTQQSYAKAGLFIEDVSLSAIIDDALTLQRSWLDRSKLRVDRGDDRHAAVRAQKSKLIHVLTNLIRNAVDAMADNPGERILRFETASGADGSVVLRVIDNGHGISRDDLRRIFSHGFTTKADGHGFGLHSCANFMTEMGGSIQAHSDGPGKGAVFSLTAPRAERRDDGFREQSCSDR